MKVTVDLFCENLTLIHYLVVAMVCNHILPFFFHLKRCVVFLKFGFTMLYSMTRETRLTKHKAIAQCTCLLDYMKCTTHDNHPFTR